MKKILLIVLLMPLGINAQVWNANANVGKWQDYFQNVNRNRCSGNTTATLGKFEKEDFPGVTGKVWKITSPVNILRSEFSRTENFTHGQNQNYYYSWRVRLSHSNALDANRFAIFQWKTTSSGTQGDGSQNHPITLAYEEGKLSLFYFRPCKNSSGQFINWDSPNAVNCSSDDRRFILKEITVAKDTWIDIVLGIKRGTAETGTNSGKVRLWINGVRQSLNNPNGPGTTTTPSCKTDDAVNNAYSASSVYPKWGIYGGNQCPFGITARIHNLKAYSKDSDAVNNLKNSQPTSKTSQGKDSSNELALDEDFYEIEQYDKNIKVYPHPVNDRFTINLENFKTAEVTITDLLGKTVFKTTTENNTIELSKGTTFKSGMYIIAVKDEFDKIYTSKLIVK